MEKLECANCRMELTETNVRLAIETSGVNEEELSFCCPSYTREDGCKEYRYEDREAVAYWQIE